ncbi:Metal-dependent hydrolase, beta-lactamase superfamily II [Azotobacter beijerinckii]|uniref:Metal-dependent hydrolase, beta-lactamase superfamily II n=1 Tax=Azotobacter beijerinckii TaxID=170623 RepID=A0A1H9K3C6_9GAMM|nr:MBL fold metallo-hydrolase [Azotobacter beijerinckii]SEQ93590.1 Metal-dependent hydrolase, beta-lactamase superfamily II [Azotobacter beijerinckii]
MGISVRILQANHGDCILVTHEAPDGVFNLLIDGGNAATFKYGSPPRNKGSLCIILDELKAKGQHIDLAILTHIDDDHIGGLLKAFKAPDYLSNMVKSIWFNSSRLITYHFNAPEIPENNVHLSSDSPETSVRQGRLFEALLDEIGCDRAPLVMAGQTIQNGPFTFTILSPDEEKLQKLLCVWPEEKSPAETSLATDYGLSFEEIWAKDSFETDTSIANGSSIAFILRANEKAMLFLGDAHDGVVVSTLRSLGYSAESKLSVDLVKVSHHGSEYNTSREFLELVESDRFIISSSGSIHGLPNKRAIARILAESEATIFFNYKKVIGQILLDHEQDVYSKRLVELAGEIGL